MRSKVETLYVGVILQSSRYYTVYNLFQSWHLMLLFGFGSFLLLSILKISLTVMFRGVTQRPLCHGSVQ